jgi:hypothetical protein
MNAEERERASARGEVRAETGASEAMQNVVIHRRFEQRDSGPNHCDATETSRIR